MSLINKSVLKVDMISGNDPGRIDGKKMCFSQVTRYLTCDNIVNWHRDILGCSLTFKFLYCRHLYEVILKCAHIPLNAFCDDDSLSKFFKSSSFSVVYRFDESGEYVEF